MDHIKKHDYSSILEKVVLFAIDSTGGSSGVSVFAIPSTPLPPPPPPALVGVSTDGDFLILFALNGGIATIIMFGFLFKLDDDDFLSGPLSCDDDDSLNNSTRSFLLESYFFSNVVKILPICDAFA